MTSLAHLFDNNRAWAERMNRERPGFFEQLTHRQTPAYLWIGCSDSRLPPNEIIGLLPGDLFVHRNVANLVLHTDLNCLAVIEYAVVTLSVQHIIVCGHHGCGGVKAALQRSRQGLAANWLQDLRNLAARNQPVLSRQPDDGQRWDRLCELNVIEQVHSVCDTLIVQQAWDRGQALTVHGWIYRLDNGLLQDLGVSADSYETAAARREAALAALS